MKRQPTDWEKIFAKWPIRGQPPKYTNSSCSSITTTKRAKDLNRHFSEKDMQTANRHIYDAQDHQYNKVSPHTGQNVCMLSHFSHVWLCDPMGCSLWGSSVHGILQARILEWVAISSSTEVPVGDAGYWTWGLTHAKHELYHWATPSKGTLWLHRLRIDSLNPSSFILWHFN